MIFGSAEPLESYCAHLLLSKDETYFSVLETKGSRSIYGPRPTVQVHSIIGFEGVLYLWTFLFEIFGLTVRIIFMAIVWKFYLIYLLMHRYL